MGASSRGPRDFAKVSPGNDPVLDVTLGLEAQQRYASHIARCLWRSYRKTLSLLFFMGYRTMVARYVANGVSHVRACVNLSTQGGYRTILRECIFP